MAAVIDAPCYKPCCYGPARVEATVKELESLRTALRDAEAQVVVLVQAVLTAQAHGDVTCVFCGVYAADHDVDCPMPFFEGALAPAVKECLSQRERDRDAAVALLERLTPGGSEFAGSPQRCYEWAQDRIAESGRLLVKAAKERRIVEAERDAARVLIEKCWRFVNEQAEDEALWFDATTAEEAYLQQALRRLHAAIEGDDLLGLIHEPSSSGKGDDS